MARTLLKFKRLEESLIATRQAVRLMPSSYETQTLLATVLLHLNRWRQARTALRQALLLKPDGVFALRWIGGAYVNEGRPEQAVELLREAVRLAPDDAERYGALVWALHCAEERADALPESSVPW